MCAQLQHQLLFRPLLREWIQILQKVSACAPQALAFGYWVPYLTAFINTLKLKIINDKIRFKHLPMETALQLKPSLSLIYIYIYLNICNYQSFFGLRRTLKPFKSHCLSARFSLMLPNLGVISIKDLCVIFKERFKLKTLRD